MLWLLLLLICQKSWSICTNKSARKGRFYLHWRWTQGPEVIKWAKQQEWIIISTMLKDMDLNISWRAIKYTRANCRSMERMSHLISMDILRKPKRRFPRMCLNNLKRYFIAEHNRKTKLKNRRNRNLIRWTHLINWLRMSDFVTYSSTLTPFRCRWTSSRALPSSSRWWVTPPMVRPSKALAILNMTQSWAYIQLNLPTGSSQNDFIAWLLGLQLSWRRTCGPITTTKCSNFKQ